MEKKELASLMHEVRELISEVDKTHRHSMSQIYGLYNRAYGTNETPQSCASCLIRKVRELRTWLAEANKKYAEMPAEEETSNSSDMSREIGNYEEKVVKKGRKKKEA